MSEFNFLKISGDILDNPVLPTIQAMRGGLVATDILFKLYIRSGNAVNLVPHDNELIARLTGHTEIETEEAISILSGYDFLFIKTPEDVYKDACASLEKRPVKVEDEPVEEEKVPASVKKKKEKDPPGGINKKAKGYRINGGVAYENSPEFPTKSGRVYRVPLKIYENFCEAYPNVPLDAEFKKAKTWLECNPSRRKTWQGMSRFLGTWMSAASERYPSVQVQNNADRKPDNIDENGREVL